MRARDLRPDDAYEGVTVTAAAVLLANVVRELVETQARLELVELTLAAHGLARVDPARGVVRDRRGER